MGGHKSDNQQNNYAYCVINSATEELVIRIQVFQVKKAMGLPP